MATFSDYLTALSAKTGTRYVKIEQLDDNENSIGELSYQLIGGDIQKTDEIGAQRSTNLVFENSSGDYIPDPDGIIWMNKRFKISTGLLCSDGEVFYVSQGIFIVSEPEVVSELSNKEASIQMLDKFSLLNGQLGGTLANTYIINSGTSIQDAVRAVLSDAGDVKDPIIESTAETLPYSINKEAGDTYGDILIELANMLGNWICFYDENGFFRFEPKTNIETTGSSWDFSTYEITYLGSRHRYEFTKVYNEIIVIGDNINGQTFRGVARDTSSSSPTGIPRIGKKTLVINDDLIYTTSLAQQRAEAELISRISIAESLDISSMPIDLLSGGDIITISDDSTGVSEDRFLIKSITFPLLNSGGNMSMSVWYGRELS